MIQDWNLFAVFIPKTPNYLAPRTLTKINLRMSKMRSAIALSQLSFRDFAASTTGIALVSETG